MLPKPTQWHTKYAAIFKDKSVVQAYQYRPSYPPQIFEILLGLVDQGAPPRTVLDAGCGTGFVARALVKGVDRVDAVDFSWAMIETGKTLPHGHASNLHWVFGPIEEVPLDPPYALITAAASLHWMTWDIVLPRFSQTLTTKGYLAIIEDIALPKPWHTDIGQVLAQYSMNTDFQSYDMMTIVEELEQRDLFERVGMQKTEPLLFQQPVDEWVESYHARNGFSRERMSIEAAAECDRQLKEIILKYYPQGIVKQQIVGRVIWGKPTAK